MNTTTYFTAILAALYALPCSPLDAQEPPGKFHCELSEVRLTRDSEQTNDYQKETTGSKDSRQLRIKIAVKGPVGSVSYGTSLFGTVNLPVGKNLKSPSDQVRTPMVNLEPIADSFHYELFQGVPKCQWLRREEIPDGSEAMAGATNEVVVIAEIQIEGKFIGNDYGRKIPRLAGIVWMPMGKQPKATELKPLSKFVGKTIPLTPPATFTCEAFADETIHYKISDLEDFPYRLQLYGEDGTELLPASGSISYEKKETTNLMTVRAEEARPSGIYAIVRYFTEFQTVAIPFEFADIEIPE